MIIVDERVRSAFDNLDMGDTFKSDGNVFIKCGLVESGVNAVNLGTGAPKQFHKNDTVETVMAELRVFDTFVDEDRDW